MSLTRESTSRTVRTADWNLHYHEAGTGHPLILLHGSGPGATGWSNFSGNLPGLARHFRVLAVDMPGWGASDVCPVDRLEHVDAALQFMDTLGIERAALIGNSMGGITAVRLAAEHPERISHLITMGAALNRAPRLFGPGDGPSEGIKVLVEAYRTPTTENMMRLVEIMCFDKRFASEDLCRQRAEAASAQPEHLTNFLAGLSKGWPAPKFASYEQLMGIRAPALLVHGRDDRVVHWEHTLHLVSHIPNSRMVLINRCGHWAMIEHADEFNRLVIDFVTHN
ncbi:MAG: alpha/beta fold hydrolase [Gammaproteobacteria bacterium]|nr:alpha/beta fold hydrolase [Gammaproteobacteria bacterium]